MTASTTKIERSAPAIRTVLAEVSPTECAQFEAEFAAGSGHRRDPAQPAV